MSTKKRNSEAVKYLYMSHTGNYYGMRRELTLEEMYCEDCRDYDDYVGEYKNEKEKAKLIKKFENRYY